jgi:hypothetical protein
MFSIMIDNITGLSSLQMLNSVHFTPEIDSFYDNYVC